MKLSPRVLIVLMISVCCGLSIGCGTPGEQGKQLLEFVVWHTENDPNAQQILEEAAESARQRFGEESAEYHVEMKISYQDWGDLAQRLLQQTERRPPDITHLQPFMVYQVLQDLRGEFELYPLTEVVERIEDSNGPIVPSLRRLHVHSRRGEDEIFGIAYAVGTTFISYRGDFAAEPDYQPRSWRELIDFADRLSEVGSEQLGRPVAPFILPGGSKFFVDQLFNEIVVSLGGSLFEDDGSPRLDSPEVREALDVVLEMIARTGGQYYRMTYLNQFEAFARGEGAVVPVTYGRATAAIERVIEAGEEGITEIENYKVMQQPGDGTGAQALGTATVDAEPWVVIARKRAREDHKEARLRLAELFLEEVYERDRYLSFCGSVPVHLRPIFPDLWSDYDQFPPQERWSHWTSVARANLMRDGGTAPILMLPGGGAARSADYLLDLSRQHIISDMINDAWEHRSGGDTAKARAISRAKVRAEALHEGEDSPF